MRIAIVGAGISGVYAAYKLSPKHEVTLYEANGFIGGHTDTHHITLDDRTCSVDTGFIVFNEENYPLFSSFLNELDVQSRPSNMSFSVSDRNSGLEYNATDLAGLICRKQNLIRPGFYRMLSDILRFYRTCRSDLADADDELTIGEYLEQGGYGSDFIDNHIIPMASALWSSPAVSVRQFPARYFVAFMDNHKMLQISNRPVWRTVCGGSSQYLNAFQLRFKGTIRLDSAVVRIERDSSGAQVQTTQDTQRYDAVILACHSDQALRLLGDASTREQELLGSIPFQKNAVTLHSDDSVMPKNPKAWASWNVVRADGEDNDYLVSYCMNLLQGIKSPAPLLVSLNADSSIDDSKVLLRRTYHHPVYSPDSLRARQELQLINGNNHTYFSGAYLGWGFHEDGVRSAQQVVDSIESKEMVRAA